MMTKQSKDWILGYVFSRLEKYIIEGHMKKLDNIDNHIISVPKYWFGLQATKNPCVTLSDEERIDYIDRLKELCCALNHKNGSYLFSIAVRPCEQYMEFAMSATRLPEVKEMTIAEIEKELGYKVKIVADKVIYDVYCPNRVCGCCTICDNRKCDHPVPNCKGFAYKPLFRS